MSIFFSNDIVEIVVVAFFFFFFFIIIIITEFFGVYILRLKEILSLRSTINILTIVTAY